MASGQGCPSAKVTWEAGAVDTGLRHLKCISSGQSAGNYEPPGKRLDDHRDAPGTSDNLSIPPGVLHRHRQSSQTVQDTLLHAQAVPYNLQNAEMQMD